MRKVKLLVIMLVVCGALLVSCTKEEPAGDSAQPGAPKVNPQRQNTAVATQPVDQVTTVTTVTTETTQ